MRKFARIIIIIAAAIMVYSGYHLVLILGNYKKSNDEYAQIRRKAVSEIGNKDSITEDVSPFDECWGYTPGTPPDVNFDELKEINKDIIGWIYIPAIDASYPVMKGKTNDTYLHTTYKGTYAYAGSIFIDELNSADFNDPNTIIYGHNMNNGSMFGRLREVVDIADPPFNPYIWIVTPHYSYCYRMFSSHMSNNTGETYSIFSTFDDQLTEWEKKMKAQSLVDFEDVNFSANDHVITLSTCYSDHVHRRIVHAIRIHAEVRTD